jgi:hypothetical protein
VIVQIAHKIKIAVDLRKGIVGRNILVWSNHTGYIWLSLYFLNL